ncbi:MAG: hypothetical protein ACPGQL_10570 [Thermoplasmatota archaeon]
MASLTSRDPANDDVLGTVEVATKGAVVQAVEASDSVTCCRNARTRPPAW